LPIARRATFDDQRWHFSVSGEALGIALEQAHLRGGDVGSFNLLAAQRARWHFPGNSRF
jgi:hypothetical protein